MNNPEAIKKAEHTLGRKLKFAETCLCNVFGDDTDYLASVEKGCLIYKLIKPDTIKQFTEAEAEGKAEQVKNDIYLN